MSGFTDLFEPEEVFGAYWHRLVGDIDVEQQFVKATVSLEDIRKRLEIFFRGVGGKPGVEIKGIAPLSVNYRQKLMAKIGHAPTTVSRARFDGDYLYLPQDIALLPEQSANQLIYKWLMVWMASTDGQLPEFKDDPLQNDISNIIYCHWVTLKVFAQFPGMKSIFKQLSSQLLQIRPRRKLPVIEAELEASILGLFGGTPPDSTSRIWQVINEAILKNLDDGPPCLDLSEFQAPAAYKTFLPIGLWGEVTMPAARQPGRTGTPDEDQREDNDGDNEQPDERTRKAVRQDADQIEDKTSLILARFEAILSWAEMMNIPRSVDDDEEDNARKAADDHDELGLANISKKASTKLKFDLDLAPQDVEHERLSAKHVYPEWDYRKNIYLEDHCRVLAVPAPELEAGSQWQPDKAARQRIRAVKRQFEALRPRPERLMRQVDGNDIDMDALIRARCDMQANGQSSDRVFSNLRDGARDLSVSVLIDVSRSSESWIEGRQVIEISREALMALTLGLAACGDNNAIYSFSSLRRDRVNVSTVKRFDENLSEQVFSRIGALRPGFYTRLGAAIRHVSAELSKTTSSKRLLLIISDGKPNDLDHYEGRYGVEDTAMAVREARRVGTAVFGVTIDKKAQSYFPYIFGRNAFAITNHASDLTNALPQMYRHLVT